MRKASPAKLGMPLRTVRPRKRFGNGVLRWSPYPGLYALRAVPPKRPQARYAVARYEGAKGPRFLCWYFPTGVHVFDQDGYRIAGGPPVGLFCMRTTLEQAAADAEHHWRTGGECRP